MSHPHAVSPPPLAAAITLLLGYALLWTTAQQLALPNLDAYHDMLENYAWGQHFEWGTFKHPPFFTWVVGVWFSLMPRSDFSYILLAYLNVALGLLGVLVLARRLGWAREALPAALLLFWCLPYTTLGAKFNANTQLLSLWPWTAVCLVTAIRTRGGPSLLWSMALGVLAAACMLSKYYSGVFLVSLFVAALASPEGRRWLGSPRMLAAAGTGALATIPHLLWLQEHGWATLRYALDQGGGQTDWRQILKFSALPFVYWSPGWLAAAALFSRRPIRPAQSGFARAFARALVQAWRPRALGDPLFWMSVTPWALSLAFGVSGLVELSMPWAIPIGFAYPLLWLRNLAADLPAHRVEAALAPITRVRTTLTLGALILAVSASLAWTRAHSGHAAYYRPTEAAAQAIIADWRARYPDTPLRWSSGDWALTAMLSFYADSSVRALPYAPDSPAAAIAPLENWPALAGVLICTADAGQESLQCNRQARAWLALRGHDNEGIDIIAHRSGWRFPKPLDHTYRIFPVLPLGTSR